MSIVIPVSAMLAGAIGAAIGFLAYLAARKLGARRASEIAAISCVVTGVALFVPMFVLLNKASTTTLIGVDPREGERHLKGWGLPANTTSDFCYRQSFVGMSVIADFQISEADFLRWMEVQKWEAVPFQINNDYDSIPVNGGAVGSADSVVYPVRQYEKRVSLKVRRGYCYMWAEPDTPDNTVKVIYDLDSHRAYFEHSTY